MKRFLISILVSLVIVSLGPYVGVAFSQRGKSIHQAAIDGKIDQVKALLEKGTNVNEKEPRMGYTPLHGAARNGRKEVVELLLDKGADINAKESSSKTPLYLAVEFRQKEMVKLLLAKGADINAATGRGENALSVARKKRNTEMVELLIAKGATEPTLQDMAGDRYYEGEDMLRPGPGGRIRGTATPAVEIDLLADPNEIMARIKTFDDLEKAIVVVAAKSATEMRYWGSTTRTDNRSYVARAVKKQVEDELALVKKIAVEEKAAKTTAAIDALIKQRQGRYTKVSRELLKQRREAMQAESSRTTGGRAGGRTSGRTSGRSSRGSGRYSSGSQASGGVTRARGGAYDDGGAYGPGMSETGRYGRPTRAGEQLDPVTEDEIRQWTQATMDNKPDLAKTVYPQIHAEFAMIRRIAVEEEAKKTTAAVDGILLARQVRFNVFIKIAEELRRTAAPGQDPRTVGRYGEEAGRTSGRRGRTTRGGAGGTQQQGGRTRRR